MLFGVVVLLSTSTCDGPGVLGCPMCSSPAFEIALVDSTGAKLNGFNIRAINSKNETLSVSDTSDAGSEIRYDSVYIIWAAAGVYKLDISSRNYQTIDMSNLSITSGKCGVNPRFLKIVAEARPLSKRNSAAFNILSDSTGRGCGN